MEPPMDYDFGSSPALNYSTAPSSPRRFGHCFFSAPASPSRMSDQLDEAMERSRSRGYGPVSAIPFDWEETPGTPKSVAAPERDGFDFDFAFDLSVESEKTSLSAEELFDGGKIRPLKPPPRLQFTGLDERVSPAVSSPIARGKKFFRDALSPRRKKQSDPLRDNVIKKTEQETRRRGREDQGSSGNNWRRGATRSLSPFRVSEFQWEEEAQHQKQSVSPFSNQKASKGLSKKWSFKNFLLFRSSSEGRAYSPLFKKQASFRSTESRRVSAHQLAHKTSSEDLKRKTSLPYKQGVWGRLAFGPMLHALGNGSGSFGR